MSLKEEIERLKHQANVLNIMQDLIEQDDFIQGIPMNEDARKEVVAYLKQCLEDYLKKSIETKQKVEEIFTQEEIASLKKIASQYPNGIIPSVAQSATVVAPQIPLLNQPIIASSPVIQQIQPVQPSNVISRTAQIIDTTYITDIYGPLENIYPEMPINLIKDEGDMYLAELPNRQDVRFPVPKDCVQNVR